MKTDMITIRIDPNLKKESDETLAKLGLTTSFAVTMFLQQVVYHGEIPFKIALPKSSKPGSEELARLINSTAGKEKADPKLEKILHLLSVGDIDYETAKFAIRRYFSK